MKVTESFKKAIESKLQEMAVDSQFAEKLKNPKKNIDDCITYILNVVQESGCSGFADDEIFGMAAHYYDEDNIEVGKPISCNVVINHKVELSEDEVNEAKQKAIETLISQEQERLSKKQVTPKKIDQPTDQQGILF